MDQNHTKIYGPSLIFHYNDEVKCKLLKYMEHAKHQNPQPIVCTTHECDQFASRTDISKISNFEDL